MTPYVDSFGGRRNELRPPPFRLPHHAANPYRRGHDCEGLSREQNLFIFSLKRRPGGRCHWRLHGSHERGSSLRQSQITWTSNRQGRKPLRNVLRDLRKGRRLLQRQGRFHASIGSERQLHGLHASSWGRGTTCGGERFRTEG